MIIQRKKYLDMLVSGQGNRLITVSLIDFLLDEGTL